MFDFVRKHTRVMQFVLFLLVFPSFVLFGIEGYSRFNEKGDVVARVDGRDVLKPEWEALHKEEMERLRRDMPDIDPKIGDSDLVREATLDRLVRERMLQAASDRLGVKVTDAKLQQELLSVPAVAALRRPDGTIDVERYKQLVGAQGLTPAGFEERLRNELNARQVVAGIIETAAVSKALTGRAVDTFLERREVQFQIISPRDFTSKVSVSDADIEAYYQANATRFAAPERAKIEYLVLDLDTVRKSITVPEADARSYFEQNSAQFGGNEQRRASHILIAVPQGAGADAKAKAKAKARAEELAAQAKKSPAKFAELARKNSQDPGSAPKGGDLDFFGRGAMVKPFEDAVFSMKEGDISPVVESEFGFHIIQLVSVRGAQKPSFEANRKEIEALLAKQLAQRKFAETAEAFSNTVYEQADGLGGPAAKFQLQLQTADNVTRTPVRDTNGNPIKGPLGSPSFLAALFAPESTRDKKNIRAVEIGPNQLASGRVIDYAPARTLPLAEVKDRVRELLVSEKAAELARAEGKLKLEEWRKDASGARLGQAAVAARNDRGLPEALVRAALRVDGAQLPAWTGVDLGAAGFAVVRVNKVLPKEQGPDAAAQNMLEQGAQQQVAQWWTNAELQAYFAALKRRYKVEVLKNKVVGGSVDASGDTGKPGTVPAPGAK
jgi:peptidyl-prolyl cis-trans isomerase D